MQLKNVNLIFLGRRYSGQLSINPVYKIIEKLMNNNMPTKKNLYFDLEIKLLIELTISDSTQQNCESAPRQNNIKKNKIDQRPEGSSCRTTYKYKNINRY